MVIAAGVWCWIRWSFRVLWADAGCRECVCRQERGGGSSSRTQQGEGGHVGLDRNRNDVLEIPSDPLWVYSGRGRIRS